MFRNTLRRSGIMLALVAILAFAGAAPASAEEIGEWNNVWGWLSGLFDLGWSEESADAGNDGGLTGIWAMEGPGFDPNGNPLPTSEEGPGFDPNGKD